MIDKMHHHYALRSRIEVVMNAAGALSLRTDRRSVSDQAALIEIDALDTRFKLLDRKRQDDPLALATIERELNRLEKRCAALSSWLATHGRHAELLCSSH